MLTHTFTHRGWMMFCPVYASFDDPEAPTVAPRHWALNPLFWLAEKAEELRIRILMLVDDQYEPTFAMLLEELPAPIERTFR